MCLANEEKDDDDAKDVLVPLPRTLELLLEIVQEAQLMLTTGSTRLAVSRGQQTWYHSTCYM